MLCLKKNITSFFTDQNQVYMYTKPISKTVEAVKAHFCQLLSLMRTHKWIYMYINYRVVSSDGTIHQENMSVQCTPPHFPLLYSKTGVCRGIPIFLIFAPKHRLWVLVRTASVRQTYPQSIF